VPRTRPHVARDDKVAEIVDAARTRLLEGGYDSLSVVAIARQLGLAQNAVYWYFPTKDHLFVAGVDRILHEVLSRKPRRGTALSHVLWFAERLHELRDLRITMRDRARTSEVVASYEADVVAMLRALLAGGLTGLVDDERLGDTVDALLALCDGVLLHDLGRAHRRRVIELGYDRLVGGV
jgi:TetR/AcrR family transcriptional regulator, cholesterol catabolism regulator